MFSPSLLLLACGATSTVAIDLARTSTAPVLTPAEAEDALRARFAIDPVGDTALIAAAIGFGYLLDQIIGTGELRPQEPGDPQLLLGIDRPHALRPNNSENASTLSNVGAAAAVVLVAGDAVLAAVLDRDDSFLTYAMLYAESGVINWALTNLIKIAVRRPRPVAYQDFRRTGERSVSTDSALSFYSAHTAIVGGLAATATYLAFARDPDGLEGWLVAAGGVGLTTFVAVERVLGGDHFPTDVIAGAFAGVAIGAMVPHFHATDWSANVVPVRDERGHRGWSFSLSRSF